MAFTTGIKIPNSVVDAIRKDANIRLFYYTGKFYLYEDNYYKEKTEISKWINDYINNKLMVSTSMIDEVEKLIKYDSDFGLDEVRCFKFIMPVNIRLLYCYR